MPTTMEFTTDLGDYATITDLQQALQEALDADFLPDSRVSFRERGRDLHLVIRWEVQDCWLAPEACTETATWLDRSDGWWYCSKHSSENAPDYDALAERCVTCQHGDCGNVSVIKVDGVNLCSFHAP